MNEESQGPDVGFAARPAAAPVLSIVIPTFNEKANISELIKRIDAALVGTAWEIVFVDDDSADGTADFVRSLWQTDSRVRCIQRIRRRGLSSACVEGILATSTPLVAVMDGDLQHDERILPQMLSRLLFEDFDIAIGSRYVEGASLGEWQRDRAAMSRFATRLSRLIVPADLKDPLSGYFMLRREVFMSSAHRLSTIGFKILLDIFASSPRPLRFCEVPYRFRTRNAGESKLDSVVIWDYGMLLLDKLVGHIVPVRFLTFSLIGGVGVGVHMAVLAVMLKAARLGFDASQTVATMAAMTSNFFLNNLLTYRDQRLTGLKMWQGLSIFYAVCGIGAAANVGVASYIFQQNYAWWLSGVAGVVIGAVWNYAATSVFTWRR
jgi:dolichol-phosphate mannosyltransferase